MRMSVPWLEQILEMVGAVGAFRFAQERTLPGLLQCWTDSLRKRLMRKCSLFLGCFLMLSFPRVSTTENLAATPGRTVQRESLQLCGRLQKLSLTHELTNESAPRPVAVATVSERS